MYGGNLPDYEATGEQFLQSIPSEGWHGSYYYHKEFHVFPDEGHEVWTIRDTGAYDLQALRLTVNFIETTKALQFAKFNSNPIGAMNRGTFTITSLEAPRKVSLNEVFTLRSNVSATGIPAGPTALVAFDNARQEVISSFSLSNSSATNTQLIFPSEPN
jgi:hypothetical protein